MQMCSLTSTSAPTGRDRSIEESRELETFESIISQIACHCELLGQQLTMKGQARCIKLLATTVWISRGEKMLEYATIVNRLAISGEHVPGILQENLQCRDHTDNISHSIIYHHRDHMQQSRRTDSNIVNQTQP
jgi:hypothetical protein